MKLIRWFFQHVNFLHLFGEQVKKKNVLLLLYANIKREIFMSEVETFCGNERVFNSHLRII